MCLSSMLIISTYQSDRNKLPRRITCRFIFQSVRQRRRVMKIGFLGAGNVTRTFGRHLINAGHTIVVCNSRGPATLADFVADLGQGAIAGTTEQAAECDAVILAVHWVKVPDVLKGIDWRGR